MFTIGSPKYPINFEFFKTDTEEYWYFLGLISSDGYISDNNIELCLNKKDEHILIKLRDIICPNKPLYYKKATHSVKFVICNKVLCKELKEKLNMTTNKKHTKIRFPKVPKEYLKDYIRGLIDGDGCIDTTKSYNKNKVYIVPRLRILSNREFLLEMLKEIKKNINNNTNAVNKKGAENVWYVTFNFETAKEILKWCYLNCNICLNRKYKKFEEVCEIKI